VQGINQVAIAEGMLLGISLGLAPELLASIINSSTGNFFGLTSSQSLLTQFIGARTFMVI